jgi:hypothetical protein
MSIIFTIVMVSRMRPVLLQEVNSTWPIEKLPCRIASVCGPGELAKQSETPTRPPPHLRSRPEKASDNDVLELGRPRRGPERLLSLPVSLVPKSLATADSETDREVDVSCWSFCWAARNFPSVRRRPSYGNAVPDFDCTSEMSELLMTPLTVTSSRKLLDVTGCPDCDWV